MRWPSSRRLRWGRGEDAVHVGDVVESLDADPESLSAGFAVAFAAAEAAEASDHVGRLMESRWRFRDDGRTVNETVERLPVIVVELEGAGQFGVPPGKMDQMEDPPGDDHIDRQTGFQ